MLSQLSSLYRIVNPSPSDDLIRQRREAIETFVPQLADAECRYPCIEIALAGFRDPPSDSQNSFAASLADAIQGPQPSFIRDIGSSAMDLRVCASIALAEYIKGGTGSALEAALTTVAAGMSRPLPEERTLATLICEILKLSSQFITSSSEVRRKRLDLVPPTIQGANVAQLAKSVAAAITTLNDTLSQNLSIDQEELQVLWWVFAGRSTTVGKRFSDLEVPQRLVLSGAELADRALLPAMLNAHEFLARVVDSDSRISIQQIVKGCDRPTLSALTKYSSDLSDIVVELPALLPLTWLFRRRLESDLASGWESEFEHKTLLSSALELPATSWAEQVFNEAVAAQSVMENREVE